MSILNEVVSKHAGKRRMGGWVERLENVGGR